MKKWIKNKIYLLTIFLFIACIPSGSTTEVFDTNYSVSKLSSDNSANTSAVSITDDFKNWLNANGYGSYHFEYNGTYGNSYGGKQTTSTAVINQPVIFIHGNGDIAVGSTSLQAGWTNSINYFIQKGYTSAELYAVSWGSGNIAQTALEYHSKTNVMRIRKFIEAVIAYTGATKVDIITHSMGVSLTRKAIKGGTANDLLAGGSYQVGTALTSKVDAFVGIAGANYGLTSCYASGPTTPTCGATNGFYPGTAPGGIGLSAYLADLNASSGYEGAFRATMWSSVDEIIGLGCLVWGQITCRIPGQNTEKKYTAAPYGHYGLKDQTCPVQYNLVKNHTL